MLKRIRTSLAVVLLSAVVLLPSAANAEAWVERAQQRLGSLGCNAGPADGDLGVRTRSAIIRFQSRHRLHQTGRLNDTTRARLYSDHARHCDTRPEPAHSGTGRRIVISQRQNWAWLVGRDGHTIAQSGLIDNPAVLGTGVTRVRSYCGRAARIKRNTDGGDLWLENFVRFAPCGIGFHRIPTYKSTGRQIHPTWMVGTNLRESHGCIRLPKPFSKKVWDFASIGTRVHVVRG
jgi:hypothetical protein